MRARTGKYQVTRFCCISGLCVDCHKRGNHGNKAKRRRMIHIDHISKAFAERVCVGWELYEPLVERLPSRVK